MGKRFAMRSTLDPYEVKIIKKAIEASIEKVKALEAYENAMKYQPGKNYFAAIERKKTADRYCTEEIKTLKQKMRRYRQFRDY